MNGGVMFSQRGATPDLSGSPAPAAPFASLPSPASVPGQVRLISDAGPAPGIELISDGAIWRPRGGSQVLARRIANPVTIQSTLLTLAETIGPFPGGLVRSGMRLRLEAWIGHSGISSANRFAFWKSVNPVSVEISQLNMALSGTDLNTLLAGTLDILADAGAGHRSIRGISSTYPNAGTSQRNINIDFSQQWETGLYLQSVNETPVNITGASWSAGVVTFTANAHTLAVGDKTTIAGITPSGYNGVYIVTSVPNANTFTATLASDPGAYVSGGTSSRISNVVSEGYTLTLLG